MASCCDLGAGFRGDSDAQGAAVWPFCGQFIAHDSTADRSPLGHRVVRPLWLELQAEVVARLDQTTIEDLCKRAQRANLAPDVTEIHDFTI